MNITAYAVAAMVAFTGCINNSDGDAASEGDGNASGMPGLYSELDSIVVNQLDFLYFTNKWSEPQNAFSDAARKMLTDDTLLFQRDSINPFGNSVQYGETFVRTKFNPKGWFAFHDTQNSMTCTPSDAGPTGDWLIRIELEPEYYLACYQTSSTSPSTRQLWVMHYQDKGFVFDASTAIGGRGFGKARVYYWR